MIKRNNSAHATASLGDTVDPMSTVFLSVDDVIGLHKQLAEHFEQTGDPIDPPGVRSMHLIGSSVARPQTSLGGEEKYKTTDEKAAALFHSLIKNHAFHNGNKRTALVSLLAFLDRNGQRVTDVTDEEVFEMVIGVASDTFPVPNTKADDAVVALTAWLAARTTAKRARASTMRTTDFVARCKKVGLPVKKDTAGWKIFGKHGVVKINNNHRDLPGNAVRVNMQTLGISEIDTGIGVDEFQEGISGEKDILRRFQSVLKRLAHE